jgi:hypothetical protein
MAKGLQAKEYPDHADEGNPLPLPQYRWSSAQGFLWPRHLMRLWSQ